MSKYRQDEERLKQLQTGDRKVWKSFFDENLDAFLLFTMKHGRVQKEQAFEFYQEALVIFHRNAAAGKLTAPLRAALQTYLFGIAKNLCRRSPGGGRLSFPADLPDIPLNPMEEEENRRHDAEVVKSLLNKIDGKCRQFLTMVFLQELPQKEVMAAMSIPSDEAFRKRKHDCLKKMRLMRVDEGL